MYTDARFITKLFYLMCTVVFSPIATDGMSPSVGHVCESCKDGWMN